MPKKKRVLVVVNTIAPYTSALYSRVAERNNVELLVLYCSQTHRNRPISWQYAAGSHPRRILGGIHAYVRGSSRDPIHVNPSVIFTIKKNKPDVVVAHGYSDITNLLSILVCRINRTPFILEVDGADLERHSFLVRTVVQSVVRSSSAFIAASQSARDFLLHYRAPADSIVTIPCVTNLSVVNGLSRRIRDLRELPNSNGRGSEPSKSLLFVGRLIEEKGVLDLLQAFREIREEYLQLRLVILGRGPLASRIERDFGADFGKSLVLLDYVSDQDLVELYSSSDALILPSHREPYGIVAMEAFVCGIPVVVTDRCGCSSALPRSPWVFRSRSGDIHSLSESIRTALKMSPSKRSLNDPEILKVIAENSYDKMAQDFEDSVFRVTSA